MSAIVAMQEKEISRLYRLDGKIEAVQTYVDHCSYVDADIILSILGINTAKMKERAEALKSKYPDVTEDLGDVLPCADEGTKDTHVSWWKRQAMNQAAAEREGTDHEGTDH